MSVDREQLLAIQEAEFAKLAQQLEVRGVTEAPRLVAKTVQEVAATAINAKKRRTEEAEFATAQAEFQRKFKPNRSTQQVVA